MRKIYLGAARSSVVTGFSSPIRVRTSDLGSLRLQVNALIELGIKPTLDISINGLVSINSRIAGNPVTGICSLMPIDALRID
jgi:hypothetical protein